MVNIPWLTVTLLVPAITAVLVLCLPSGAHSAIKLITIVGALVTACLVISVLANYQPTIDSGYSQVIASPLHLSAPGRITFHFEERHDWIPAIGASYHVGIDGLGAWLLALNAGVFLLGAVMVSARATERLKIFCFLMLLTEVATAGVIMSLDLLLFYLFWEGMLIPLYFLLSGYGDENRSAATLKFIVYTVAGSLLMLVAIIVVYFQPLPQSLAAAGAKQTFDVPMLIYSVASQTAQQPMELPFFHLATVTPMQLAFLAFALAFAIKVPLVPFHTWLPGSYTSAPIPVLMFFAGIVSKLGAFGFLRYSFTLFPGPAHDFRWVMAGLAVLSIVYGALAALAQTDIKRIVAYASISHLGFVVLGIFAFNDNGINGAIIQMVNHGIVIAALFIVVGIIEQRTGTRDIRELGGLQKCMPRLYVAFLVITLAGLGMPGMNTFVGEFAIMLGAFQASWVLAVGAGLGVILACWYMLRFHQGVMHRSLPAPLQHVTDMGWADVAVLLPALALMVGIGVFPKPVGDISHPTVDQYTAISQTQQQTSSTTVVTSPNQ